MKIVAWNCNMAYRKKANRILSVLPDLVVISEAESDAKIDFSKHDAEPNDYLWVGDNPNKGLLIASYDSNTSISINPAYDPSIKYAVPVDVKFGNSSFFMLASWTQNTGSTYSSYVVQAHRAANFYKDLFDENSLFLGDLNSNAMWDNGDRKEANHSDLVSLLRSLGLESLYHWCEGLEHGRESQPTLLLHKNLDKPYHVDYIFAGKAWQKRLENFRVGKFKDWVDVSDHVPLIAEFNYPSTK